MQRSQEAPIVDLPAVEWRPRRFALNIAMAPARHMRARAVYGTPTITPTNTGSVDGISIPRLRGSLVMSACCFTYAALDWPKVDCKGERVFFVFFFFFFFFVFFFFCIM